MEGTLGEIRMFAGNYAPQNWALCEGQTLEIDEYNALYSILGTLYGGDGRSTFALPDMRGRVPIGNGSGPGLTPIYLGQNPGVESVSLGVGNMPEHQHTIDGSALRIGGTAKIKCDPTTGTGNLPEGSLPAGTSSMSGPKIYSPNPPEEDKFMNDAMVDLSGAQLNGEIICESTGGGGPHNNMQPSSCINFIICLLGDYPSRS